MADKDEFHPVTMKDNIVLGIRKRGGKSELAAVTPIQEGKPIPKEFVEHGEFVKATLRDEETVLDLEAYGEEKNEGSKGPAKYNTKRFRAGYDAVFGKKKDWN
jgi:hypothetical protein